MLVNSIKTKNNFHNYIVIKQSDNTSSIELLLCGANGSILSDLKQSCTLTILDEVDQLIRQKTKEQIVNGTVTFRVTNDLKTNPHTLEITTSDGQKFPSNHDFKIFVSYTHDESELKVINNLSRDEALAEIDQSVKSFITNNTEDFIDKVATAKWLNENNFKPKDAVATFNDLPNTAELKEIRGVLEENAVYVFDGTNWVKQSNINFDGLSAIKNDVEDTKNKLDETVKEMYLYKNKVVDIYVDGDLSVNGNGTKESPYNNLDSAITELKSKSDKAIEGTYNIRIAGTINKGHKIYNLPNFREPINFIGETDLNGEPITVFDGANASRKMGLWFEPANNLEVNVDNIIFKNYGTSNSYAGNATIGYGVLMKDKGKLQTTNCKFLDNYIGVGGINQNRTIVHSCYFNNNYSGAMTQYNSTLTIGSLNDIQNTWNTFENNGYGVTVSRNSIAHVDYNTLENSTYAGVLIDISARANVFGNEINDNKMGVMLHGSAEWINNENNFTGNEVDYQHFGVSRETRLHSQYTNIFFDYEPFVPTNTKTSLTNANEEYLLSTTPSTNSLTKQQLTGKGKKFKVKIVGNITKNSSDSVRLLIKTVNNSNAGTPELFGLIDFDNHATFDNFEYELISTNIDINKQSTTNKCVSTNGNNGFVKGLFTRKFSEDKRIRVYATSTIGGATVTIDYIQISVAG